MRVNFLEKIRKLISTRLTHPEGGFDRIFRNIKVVSGGGGNLDCELDVSKEMLNGYKTLHGGCTATLVDFVSTLALADLGEGKLGVSMDLNVSYLKPAFENDTILIQATTLKHGRNVAVGKVDILNKATGAMIATGRHTKFIGDGNTKKT